MTDDKMPEPVALVASLRRGSSNLAQDAVMHQAADTITQLRAVLAAQAQEIERLREVVTACHQALFQAQEAAKVLMAKGEMPEQSNGR